MHSDTDQSNRFRMAVLISGGGTTLKNILQRIDAGTLGVEVSLVISSSPEAKGLSFARERDIPTAVVRREDHGTQESFSEAVFAPLREADVQLVVMGGYLKLVLIPDDYAGRVINIHPSLIPAFCGKGYYGRRVHQAVLEYGAKVSGCTVHFVDNQYDHGPIIFQRTVPVLADDTPESLQQRVFEQECEVYPEAIQACADGRVYLQGRTVRVDGT